MLPSLLMPSFKEAVH